MINVISIGPCRVSWSARHKECPRRKNKAHIMIQLLKHFWPIIHVERRRCKCLYAPRRIRIFLHRYYRFTNARFPELGAANAFLQNRNIGLTFFHALAPTNRFS
jgi:hypothetical protein